MAKLALKVLRILLKTLLFIGLFRLSVQYVHTYPLPMPPNQLTFWLSMSERLGIRDVDELYVFTMIFLELIVTIIAYKLILKLCRLVWKKWLWWRGLEC